MKESMLVYAWMWTCAGFEAGGILIKMLVRKKSSLESVWMWLFQLFGNAWWGQISGKICASPLAISRRLAASDSDPPSGEIGSGYILIALACSQYVSTFRLPAITGARKGGFTRQWEFWSNPHRPCYAACFSIFLLKACSIEMYPLCLEVENSLFLG